MMMEALEAQWRRVQPPTYFTQVGAVSWPAFPPDATELVCLSDVAEAVLLWVDSTTRNGRREDNSAELSPVKKILTAQVFKDTTDLQKQMALGEADLIHVMEGDPMRNHPDYTGANTWGLLTRQAQGSAIEWQMPKGTQSYGIGIVWSLWDVEYRHPFPAG